MSWSQTRDLYESHHRESRGEGFSVLKDQRGQFFAQCIGTGKQVLDLGCRDGVLTEYFAKGNDVTGVDVDEVSLQRASARGLHTKPMDLMGDWNELDGATFDAIVAGELLEHLFHPENVVKKVYDHLRRGGVFVGSVPNAYSLKNRLRYLVASQKNTPLADPTHINQFSAALLTNLLRSAFSDVHVSGLGRFRRLATMLPNWCAFDLVFIARK